SSVRVARAPVAPKRTITWSVGTSGDDSRTAGLTVATLTAPRLTDGRDGHAAWRPSVREARAYCEEADAHLEDRVRSRVRHVGAGSHRAPLLARALAVGAGGGR